MEQPNRKRIRLENYDYSAPGGYFITVCTKNKEKLLGSIEGHPVDGPRMHYTPAGEAVCRQLKFMADFYDDVKLDHYVVMPNHVHLLLRVTDCQGGPSGRPVPTNSAVAKFVGSLKRFTNRQCGQSLWQARSNDRIVRGERDYLSYWNYIENNPAKWTEDRLYVD